VKVAVKDGRLSGYVGGWALQDLPPKAAVTTANPVSTEVPKTQAAPTLVVTETPNNETLAIQITCLRLKVLSLDRDMDIMKKDIRKIKRAQERRAKPKHQETPS
jgi:hypothetical protein